MEWSKKEILLEKLLTEEINEEESKELIKVAQKDEELKDILEVDNLLKKEGGV